MNLYKCNVQQIKHNFGVSQRARFPLATKLAYSEGMFTILGYSYLRLGFRKLVINWQKSERKWNSLGMPVDRKRLPDGLMQSFLIYVQPHQSDKTKWPSRQFCWKLTGSRHLCFGDVTWPRFRDNCRRLG